MRSGGFDKVSWIKAGAARGLKDGPLGLTWGEKGNLEKSGVLCPQGRSVLLFPRFAGPSEPNWKPTLHFNSPQCGTCVCR